MGVEFAVEPVALKELGGQLHTLKEELDEVENMVDGYDEAAGSAFVADRLRAFAENWSDRREEISDQLEAVSSYASAAADASRDTEGNLAASFQDARSGSPG